MGLTDEQKRVLDELRLKEGETLEDLAKRDGAGEPPFVPDYPPPTPELDEIDEEVLERHLGR